MTTIKVFKTFPKGGALARTEGGNVVFVSDRARNRVKVGETLYVGLIEANQKGGYVDYLQWEREIPLEIEEGYLYERGPSGVSIYTAKKLKKYISYQEEKLLKEFSALGEVEDVPRGVNISKVIRGKRIFFMSGNFSHKKRFDDCLTFLHERARTDWANARGAERGSFKDFAILTAKRDELRQPHTIRNELTKKFLTPEMEKKRRFEYIESPSEDGRRKGGYLVKDSHTDFSLLQKFDPERAQEVEEEAERLYKDMLAKVSIEVPSAEDLNELKGGEK